MIRRAFEVSAGILMALILSQFPTFHQQYLQRLGGHVDELTTQVTALDARAARIEMSRFEYIRSLKNNPEVPAQMEGAALEDLITRHVRYSQSLERLATLSMLYMGPVLVFEAEPQVALTTLSEFSPGLSLTLTGAGYTLFGYVLGYFGLMALFSLVLFPKRPVPESAARPR